MAKAQVKQHEKLIDFQELSQQTGLTVSFLKKAKWKMGLPHYKIGKNVRFRLSEIEVWLTQRRARSAS